MTVVVIFLVDFSRTVWYTINIMKYDIAAKVAVDIGKEAILRRFLKMEPGSIQLMEELPEETVSLRRSDFPLHVVLKDGQEVIVLLEIQTVFNRDFILRLIDYTVRFMLKYHLKVIPLVLLLTPSSLATGAYADDLFTFNYHVVRFWEEESGDFLDEMQLYPFLPLMAGGKDTLEEAEIAIYENAEISMEKKGDLLTAMAIFAGLKDKELAVQLIKRRRDIMIQSAAYDIIKQEGIKEGIKEGEKRGLYDAISLGLELKFGTDGLALMEKVLKVESREKLEVIKEAIKIANKIEEVEKLI